MYQPPHRRAPAPPSSSASLPATPAPSASPIPSARQPPLPNNTMRARRDLSLPTGTGGGARAAPMMMPGRGAGGGGNGPNVSGKGANGGRGPRRTGEATPTPGNGNNNSPRLGSPRLGAHEAPHASPGLSSRFGLGHRATPPPPPLSHSRSPSHSLPGSPGPSGPAFRRPQPSEMEMLASVARSGGDGAEGDALKDFETQVRFRAYIDEKIHQYHHAEDDGAVKNIVRLFRKLREGIVASGRLDRFSVEVFESSVRYAVIAHDAPQLLSALSGLVPDLYRGVDAAAPQHGDCARRFDHLEKLAAEPGTPDGRAKVVQLGEAGAYDASRLEHLRALAGEGATNGEGSTTSQPPLARHDHDNRAHFASLLLIYHLVHSPRPAFQAMYESLVAPAPRQVVQRDYTADAATLTLIPPPDTTPFTTPAHLSFARRAARALAPETFDSLAFGRMVRGTSKRGGDHPVALERALLAWAAGRVRDMAGERLKKAYLSTSTEWAAALLNLELEAGEMLMWAMANGAGVRDGVVKLR